MNRSVFIIVTSIVSFSRLAFAADKKPPTTGPVGFEKFQERIPGTLVKFEMLPIPAGKFLFSVDGKSTPKEVQIKRFWMAKTECTWDLYYVFWYQDDLPRNQRNLRVPPPERPDFFLLEHPDRGFGGLRYPVISTTPHAAEMYCRCASSSSCLARRRSNTPRSMPL